MSDRSKREENSLKKLSLDYNYALNVIKLYYINIIKQPQKRQFR